MEKAKKSEFMRGIYVFIALAVLTGAEYVLAVNAIPVIVLVVIGLLKAAAVVVYFMHVKRVFSSDEGGHS